MSSGRFATVRSLGLRVMWLIALLVVVWPLQSVLLANRVPVSLRLVVTAVALGAAVRPGIALVGVAFLAPLGYALVTQLWKVYPVALPEALVLAFFAGYLVAERRRFLAPPVGDPLRLPSVLFGLVVLGAALVQLRILQIWHDYPLEYAVQLTRFLRTDYLTDLPDPRDWIDGRGFLSVPALLVEGFVLMRCSRHLCTRQQGLSKQVMSALVAASVVAAALGLIAPLAQAGASHESLWRTLMGQRWSTPAIPSLNTAGPYFLLMTFLGAAGAAASKSHVSLWIPSAAISLAAMWVTQTRSSIVSGLAVVTALAAWMLGVRYARLPSRAVVAAAVALAVAFGVVIVLINPGHILAEGVSRSLRFRLLFAETGLRMFASAPLTGVGTAQYEVRYGEFASDALLALDPRRNNAHNYLLWMGAELGVLGLCTFLWLLGAALREIWLNLVASPAWPRRILVLGLVAFLVTWSIGQPISIPQVAYTFWIVMGVAAAPEVGTRTRSSGGRRPGWFNPLAIAAVTALVAITLPSRVRAAASDIDLSRAWYGFHETGVTEDQQTFRWAGPRLTFFQRPSTRAVDVSLSAAPAMPNGARVRIWVDGVPRPQEWLEPQRWRTVRIGPGVPATTYWRIDMEIEAIGRDVPTSDRRIAVGALTRIPVAEGGGH